MAAVITNDLDETNEKSSLFGKTETMYGSSNDSSSSSTYSRESATESDLYDSGSESKLMIARRRRLSIFLIFAIIAIALAVIITIAVAGSSKNLPLSDCIEEENLRKHINKIYDIALKNGNNRLSFTKGYNETADYILETLNEYSKDLNITKQYFVHDYIVMNTNTTLSFTYQGVTTNMVFLTDFSTEGYGKYIKLTNEKLVYNSYPCNASSYDPNAAAFVNMADEDECTMNDVMDAAIEGGSKALVILLQKGKDLPSYKIKEFVFRATPRDIPIYYLRYDIGISMVEPISSGMATITSEMNFTSRSEKSYNMIIETKNGNPDAVVMLGAHMDSVAAGPGINDNGSGVAGVLEIARLAGKYNKLKNPINKIRFIFFAYEEYGLVGSAYYVNSLSQHERDSIVAFMNTDMPASPNYVLYLSDYKTALFGSEEGNYYLNNVLLGKYLNSIGEEYDLRPLNASSDQLNFWKIGIPTVEICGGAGGLKTEEQYRMFGGMVGAPYDPCYHKACDTDLNLNYHSFKVLSKKIINICSMNFYFYFLIFNFFYSESNDL